MRSRKVEPAAAVTRTLIQSDSTAVPPGDGRTIAAGFADDGRRLAGDRRFVDGRNPSGDLSVAGDQIAGLDQHDVADLQIERVDALDDVAERGVNQALGASLRARLAQGVGLRAAAPFRNGFGEIGE